MATPSNDPNRELLTRTAELLRPLADELVFVGGCATGLLITDPASGGVRATNDVDAIVEVSSYAKYNALSDRLRALGFREDTEDGVICRWRHAELVLDVMPTHEAILGFSNRWFEPALASARDVKLGNAHIRAISPVYFLATTLEAFRGRGRGDFANSHDLEDAITVIDGRPEIADEVRAAETDVRRYLSTESNVCYGTRVSRTPSAGSCCRTPAARPDVRSCSAASGCWPMPRTIREQLPPEHRITAGSRPLIQSVKSSLGRDLGGPEVNSTIGQSP